MGLLSNFRHKFHNAFFTQVLFGTVASLAIFLTSWDHLDRMRDRLQSKLQNDSDTFDFIVVGAGSAGSVVANRLSQYYTVLLLEVGGEPHPFQAVPGLAFFMLNHAEVDWMHRSVPQKRAFGNSLKREASLSQGKGLGGSGNLNFLNYLRGSPLDYENWKNITGDKSWGYDEMRKYFQLVEHYSKETSIGSTPHKGAVQLDIPDYVGLSEEFITAGQQLGYKHVDLNDQFVEGFDVNYYPLHNGVRQAPYQSYIKTARGRKSLTIRKFSHVNKILFRDDSNQAYGVEYERHGERKIAKATKEVVLSAGALSTPKILMLSGIGPAQHLQDIGGIPLRLDLPVGKNLQDHISTPVGPFFIKEPRSLLVGKDIATREFLEWGMNGKGPLTTSFYQASGLIMSSFAKTREEDFNWADIHLQLSSIAVHKTYAQDLAHAYNLQENLVSQYYGHAASKNGFTISVSNGRPVARGEVLLSGREPQDILMINPRYLEDSYSLDVNILKDGIKKALRLAENSTSFQKLGARFTEKRLPGCEHVEFRSDAYWECYIRQFSISMQSFCGTAAMGEASSKYSVVDPELKVIGATGLRIIDASVMPTITVGGTYAATLAIGEKGADTILQYWRQFDVPSKIYDTVDATSVPDSFSGFSFLGKDLRAQRTIPPAKANVARPQRKGLKQKVKTDARTPVRQTVSTTIATSTTTTTKPETIATSSQRTAELEHAETRFSHNLNTIMEFLRNSRAINEAIDDDTYNDLVQNFGERIVEIMKRNKTDIFFVPVTTTSTPSPEELRATEKSTTTNTPSSVSKTPTTTRKPRVTTYRTQQPKNNVGSSNAKESFRKPTGNSTPVKNAKQYQPISYSTTGRPNPAKLTTVTRKLSTYFLNTSGSPKQKVTTAIPKKLYHSSTFPPAHLGKTQGKFSAHITINKPTTQITAVPKKVSTTVITTRVPSSSFTSTAAAEAETTTYNQGEIEDATSASGSSEEEVTHKPEESEKKVPTKYVELILNRDLSINKTVEVNPSARQVQREKERELIEYRTEELRPFSQYPPYKIVSVPGQEFLSPRLIPQNLVPISPVLIQHHPSLSLLTPPPPLPPQNVHVTQQASIQLPIPQFQQAQLIPPPKLPAIIDENLPIQTAKTVLYYTQVFPRNPQEIRNGNINTNIATSSSSSSSSSASPGVVVSNSVSRIPKEDPSQNIVQFFPSILKK